MRVPWARTSRLRQERQRASKLLPVAAVRGRHDGASGLNKADADRPGTHGSDWHTPKAILGVPPTSGPPKPRPGPACLRPRLRLEFPRSKNSRRSGRTPPPFPDEPATTQRPINYRTACYASGDDRLARLSYFQARRRHRRKAPVHCSSKGAAWLEALLFKLREMLQIRISAAHPANATSQLNEASSGEQI